ncbi:hypothetical protein NUSPORA_00362 [Nucleospora cyclopteri]
MRNYKTFKHPYVLVEDKRGKYQSLYKEYLKKPPTLYLTAESIGCPFLPQIRPKSKSTQKSKKNKIKQKYCEICLIKYEDYQAHVSATAHSNFGKDNNNYIEIDKFIEEIKTVQFSQRQIPLSPCSRLTTLYAKSIFNSSCNSCLRLSKESSFINETEEIIEDVIEDFINYK